MYSKRKQNLRILKSTDTSINTFVKRNKNWFLISVAAFLSLSISYRYLRQPLFNVSIAVPIGSNTAAKQSASSGNPVVEQFNKTIRSDAFISSMQEQHVSANIIKDEFADIQLFSGKTSDTVWVNITTSEPQQARLFLQQLYVIFQLKNNRNFYLNNLDDSLAILSHEIAFRSKQERVLKLATQQLTDVRHSVTSNPEIKKQLAIFLELKPYLNNADHQFQLIPTTFPVKDKYINELIFRFNAAQNAKQSLLSNGAAKLQLLPINDTIIETVRLLTGAINNAREDKATDKLRGNDLNYLSKKDSLFKLQNEIDLKIRRYATLATQKRTLLNSSQNIRSAVIKTSKADEEYIGLYILSSLFGILLPLAIFYFFPGNFNNELNKNPARSVIS